MKLYHSLPARRIWTACLLLLVSGSGMSTAMAEEKDGESALPEGIKGNVSLKDFQELLSNSPFRRLLSLSDDLILTGVAKFPDGEVVTIMDLDRRETYTVSSQENAQGFRLIEVIPKNNLEEVAARIAIGKQEITVRFDSSRMEPPSRRWQRQSKVEPGKEGEKPSVEQLLAGLDPTLLEQFDQLEQEQQEFFKSAFSEYMEIYPGSSSELRLEYAREVLAEVSVDLINAEQGDNEVKAGSETEPIDVASE